jgi:hypothetical protein
VKPSSRGGGIGSGIDHRPALAGRVVTGVDGPALAERQLTAL